MKKTRIILALLMAVLALWTVFPAIADEVPGSMDVSPGGGDEPPVEEPTDPPVVDPTDDPEPTDEPTTDPEPTEDPEPTDEPTEDPEPTEEPTAEPTEEPTPEPPVYNNGGNSGNSGDTNQGSATRPGVNAGGIRQPSSSRRPSSSTGSGSPGSSGGSGGAQAPLDDGPQYVTFARVTQKSNSMSRTLFYSGAACIGTGVLGLVVLVVFIVRGRHVDDRDEIIAEIEQAEVRRPAPLAQSQQARRQAAYEDDPYAQYDQSGQQAYDPRYAQGYDSPAPSLHRPEPEELAVPVNGGLYTEEFELPPQQADNRRAEPIVPAQASVYTEEFEPPRQAAPSARAAVRPKRASVYTEEFSLPDEMSRPPVQRQQLPQAPAPAPRQVRRQSAQPRPSSQVPPDQMDTTELLREILYGEDNK